MIKMIRSLALALVMLTVFNSCKKDQLEVDEKLIKEFIAKNNIPALRHESGLYYQIILPGSGSTVTLNTIVSVKYTGRLLNGSVFDGTTTDPATFPLANLIEGWQKGIPLIRKGGKLRLLIPSSLGYKQSGSGRIPGNSVLDFDIELVNVQN